MTTFSVILVIAVVVLIGVGGVFIALIFDNRKKESALEKRMHRIEQNLGNINDAVHRFPQEMEITARNVASSMVIPQQPQTEQQPQLDNKQVFRAPEPEKSLIVQRDTGISLEDILGTVSDIDEVLNDVERIIRNPERFAAEPEHAPAYAGSETDDHEVHEIDEITLEDILEEFKDTEEETVLETESEAVVQTIPAEEPVTYMQPAPVSAPANPEPYETVEAEAEPYETVAASPEPRDILPVQPEPEAPQLVQPEPVAVQPKPAVMQPEPVSTQPKPAVMQPEIEPPQVIQPGPAMDDRAIRAVMNEVITAEPEFLQKPTAEPKIQPAAEVADNNVTLKSGSRIRSILSDSAADSALDIYFTNGKFTPQKSNDLAAEPAPEEAYDYGRSGKKYTVSELEALIRD